MEEKRSIEAAVMSSNEININLFRQYRQNQSYKNIFFSPFSIALILSILYRRTKGKTKKQLRTILNVEKEDKFVDRNFHSLLNYLIELSHFVTLHVALVFALDKKYNILSEFSEHLKKNYNVDVKRYDFKKNPDTIRQEINQMIETSTHQKIKDIFPQDSIIPDSKLLVANAVYFKGKWKLAFDETLTQQKPFYTIKSGEVMVDMMYRYGDYSCYHDEELSASFLNIPYRRCKFALIIILPDDKNGLPILENTVSSIGLNNALQKMILVKGVHITIPKFKLEETIDVKNYLIELGMKDAFSSKGDFCDITSKRNLFISSNMHKALVEFDEEGLDSRPYNRTVHESKDVHFVVNHPFMFLIVESKMGLVLFTGSVYNL